MTTIATSYVNWMRIISYDYFNMDLNSIDAVCGYDVVLSVCIYSIKVEKKIYISDALTQMQCSKRMQSPNEHQLQDCIINLIT